MKKQISNEALLFGLMIAAVVSGLIYFCYKAWGPKEFKAAPVNKNISAESKETAKNAFIVVSTSELKEKILKNENIFLLDVQTMESFKNKHIPNSTYIPAEMIRDEKDKIPREKEIIVIGSGEKIDSCKIPQTVAENLGTMGYTPIYLYREGVIGWEEAGNPLVSGGSAIYKNISADQLKQKIEDKENILIVDLRDKTEYDQKHIMGAVHMEFSGILSRTADLPRDKDIIFYDKTDAHSKLVVEQIVQKGFLNAQNLIEGFRAWEAKGYPTE